jgi:hypothetical protein
VRKTTMLAALGFAFGFASAAAAFAQQSPAPDRPAEGPLRANPGSGTAPGVHPPSPMDGNRFAPGPPPPMPGTEETPPGGKVKTEEKIAISPTAGTTPAVTPTPAGAAKTPTASAPARTPTPKSRKPKKSAPRGARTPAAKPPPTPVG